MPKDITQPFRTQKDKLENQPITLYRVQIDSNSYLYLAQDIDDVDYFEPDTDAPQTYTKSGVHHERIEISNRGEIPTVEFIYPNIDRYIHSLLHHGSGLSGLQVVIITVFRDNLDDKDACIKEKFYISRVHIGENDAKFTCSSVNLHTIDIPIRRYQRDLCQ